LAVHKILCRIMVKKRIEPTKTPLTPLEATIMRNVREAIRNIDIDRPKRIEIRLAVDYDKHTVTVDYDTDFEIEAKKPIIVQYPKNFILPT